MHAFFRRGQLAQVCLLLQFLSFVWGGSMAQEIAVDRVLPLLSANLIENFNCAKTGYDKAVVGANGSTAVLNPQPADGTTFVAQTSIVRVSFNEELMELIMVFSDDPELKTHSVIDLSRLADLEYRTRVMRYFGGLFKNQTYYFKTLCLVRGEERTTIPFTRENVNRVVSALCQSASKNL